VVADGVGLPRGLDKPVPNSSAARRVCITLGAGSVTRHTLLTNMGDISLVTSERAMRAKPIHHPPGNSGLGRAIVLAVVFIGGMYAIAAALISVV